MVNIRSKLKSNKGFTLEDLAVAILALVIFSGMIGQIYITILTVKLDAEMESVATIYAIKMLEYIDKVNYDKVNTSNKEDLINEMRNTFNIDDTFDVSLDISDYTPSWETEDYIKQIKLTVKYSYEEQENTLSFKSIKVKEL